MNTQAIHEVTRKTEEVLTGRKVLYLGRKGDSHMEEFPSR